MHLDFLLGIISIRVRINLLRHRPNPLELEEHSRIGA
jgi:hypothetical protein